MRGGAPRTETPGREDPTRLDGRRACRASPERRALRDGFPTPHRNRQSVVGGHSPRTCRTPVAQAPSRRSWRDGRWHAYWTRHLMAMRRASIHVTSRPLRYHPETIVAQDGSSQRVLVLFPARRHRSPPCLRPRQHGPHRPIRRRCGIQPRSGSRRSRRRGPRNRSIHRAVAQDRLRVSSSATATSSRSGCPLFAPPGPGSVLRARPWGPRRYAPRPQGRKGNRIQCHRVFLCGHRSSPPPPYSNSKGRWCLSHVGREGSGAAAIKEYAAIRFAFSIGAALRSSISSSTAAKITATPT